MIEKLNVLKFFSQPPSKSPRKTCGGRGAPKRGAAIGKMTNTYILFDHYKHSEPDFEDRRRAYEPHARVCVPCVPKDRFPRGGNGRELRNIIEAYVAPGDVAANMQMFTGDYLPRGYVVLR